MDQITVYGAPWCPDCRRSMAFLQERRVPFTWVDIDQDGVVSGIDLSLLLGGWGECG